MSEAKAPAAPAAKPVVQSPNSDPAQAPKPAVPDYRGTRHTVKVDKTQGEVDYDELVRGYQTAQSSGRRFQEAKAIATEANKIMSRFEDPRDAIGLLTEKFGRDKAKAVVEDWLIEQMEEDALPEPEKRAREFEKKAKTLEEQLAEERKEKEAARKARIEAKAHNDLDQEIHEALSKIGRKPTPRLAIRVIDEMIMRGSKEDIPADKALEFAQRGIHEDLAEYLEDMSPADAFKVLPKKFLQSLRQYEVEQVLGEKQQRRPKVTKPDTLVKPGEKLSFDEKFDRLKTRVAKKA